MRHSYLSAAGACGSQPTMMSDYALRVGESRPGLCSARSSNNHRSGRSRKLGQEAIPVRYVLHLHLLKLAQKVTRLCSGGLVTISLQLSDDFQLAADMLLALDDVALRLG